VLGYRPSDKTIIAVLGKDRRTAKDLGTKLSEVAHGVKVVLKSEQKSTAQPNVLIPTDKFAMPGLDRDRGLRIYVPPDYSAHPERRYPVIYMHDGQNLFDAKTGYAGEWEVDETLNALARTDHFAAIVVGIDNGGEKRTSELNPYPGPELKVAEGPDYMRFIVEVVKPYIDKTYRTLPDRDHTAIIGSSMGGLISHYALQAYPEVFSKYGLFSPSYWASPELVARAEKTPPPAGTRIYIYVGHLEGAIMEDKAKAMADTLTAEMPPGTVTYHVQAEAKHDEAAWRTEFPTAIRWLFEER
jgi:predicted alpha/beta superfamily hydrolase